MYWLVDGCDRYYDVNELFDVIFSPNVYDDDDAVDEYINEIYSDQHVEIHGCNYSPAEILKNCDEPEWYDIKSEWQEEQADNDRDYYRSDIENMDNHDYEWYNGYRVECVYEDEDLEDEDDEEDEVCVESQKVWKDESSEEAQQIDIKDLLTNFQTLY